MEKDGLIPKRGHAIIGFNNGLPCYVKNMALGPQSRQKPRPTASVFVYLRPSGHVFNIAWQAMIKTYNISYAAKVWNTIRSSPIGVSGDRQPIGDRHYLNKPVAHIP